MYDLEEVLADAIAHKPRYQEDIQEFLAISEGEYRELRKHFNPKDNFTVPEQEINELMAAAYDNFNIRKQGDYIDDSATQYSSDIYAYPPDGAWTATLYKFLGYYMWLEPEGEENGFFRTLKEAEAYGKANYRK